MTVGVVAIARPTFDVPFAESTAATAVDTLRAGGLEVVGTADLRMDEDAVRSAVRQVTEAGADRLVVIQATFADSSLAVAATETTLPTLFWAVPEDRTGGRLRLNSFCGINLAAFTLTNLGRDYRWLHAEASDASAVARIDEAFDAVVYFNTKIFFSGKI